MPLASAMNMFCAATWAVDALCCIMAGVSAASAAASAAAFNSDWIEADRP